MKFEQKFSCPFWDNMMRKDWLALHSHLKQWLGKYHIANPLAWDYKIQYLLQLLNLASNSLNYKDESKRNLFQSYQFIKGRTSAT